MSSFNDPQGGSKKFSQGPYSSISPKSKNSGGTNPTPSQQSGSYNVIPKKITLPTRKRSMTIGKFVLMILVLVTVVCVFKMCTKGADGNSTTAEVRTQDTANEAATSIADINDADYEKLSFTQPSPDTYDVIFDTSEDNPIKSFNIELDQSGTLALVVSNGSSDARTIISLYDKKDNLVSSAQSFDIDEGTCVTYSRLEKGNYTATLDYLSGGESCEFSIYFPNQINDITSVSDQGIIIDSTSAPLMENEYSLDLDSDGSYYFTIETDAGGYGGLNIDICDERGNYETGFCVNSGSVENYQVDFSSGTHYLRVYSSDQAASYKMKIYKI